MSLFREFTGLLCGIEGGARGVVELARSVVCLRWSRRFSRRYDLAKVPPLRDPARRIRAKEKTGRCGRDDSLGGERGSESAV